MISGALVKYVLTAALRDRLFAALILALLVAASVSAFLGSAAVVEPDRFALVFTAAGLRFTCVTGLVLFIVFHIRRAFESKDVDLLLSRPLSRVSFLLSHAAAFSILAFLVTAASVLVIAAISWRMTGTGAGAEAATGVGIPLWGLSLLMELVIVATAALFFSMVITSATGGAMAVFGLYALARLMGDLLGIVHHGGVAIPGAGIMEGIIQTISLVVPRLDLMAQTTWLVYGSDGSIGVPFVLMQGVIYSALLLLAALLDLVRRQF